MEIKKRRKNMEITAFKDKCCILPLMTFNYFDLNILSWRSSFDENSIFLDF
jgi:hypothetical protein